LLGAEGLDLGSALLGTLGGAGFGDAIGSELVADEGRDGLSVVLETRSRAVGRACALPLQGVVVAVVLVGVITAKSIAGILLGSTPTGSSGEIDSVGIVKGHLKRAVIALDRLGRNGRNGHGENSKR